MEQYTDGDKAQRRAARKRAGFNWWEAWRKIKNEGFGGRLPFGGRPGALGPKPPPLNPALARKQIRSISVQPVQSLLQN